MIVVLFKFLQRTIRTGICKQRLSRKTKIVLLFILLIGLITLPIQIYLFGYGPTRRGGQLGRLIDNSIRCILFERAMKQHDQLPTVQEETNKVGVHVLIHTWLVEVLIRISIITIHYDNNNSKSCPFVLFRINEGDWYHPISNGNG